MNVYHKVLTRIFEITGGKDSVDVDLIELLKKEGFYSNIDNIEKQLLDDGWVSETKRKHTIRITHWGGAEAKRVLNDSPDRVNEVEKNSNRMLAEGRELLIMLEEFVSGPEVKKLDNIEKRISELSERAKAVRSHL
jgi:hypothetical protein